MQVCSTTNILLKYNWHLNLTNNEAAVGLELQSIKKYWRCAAQVVDKLIFLYDFLLTFIIFVNKACIDYN